MNARLLSAGPMPPPPLPMWQPTQLKALKAFMPRCAAAGSPPGILILGLTEIAPGTMVLIGTSSQPPRSSAGVASLPFSASCWAPLVETPETASKKTACAISVALLPTQERTSCRM